MIRGAAREGVEHFGESYLQEALPKIETLRGLELTWHFVGQLQANKTRVWPSPFHWVHGVDRLRIAERLSDQRPFHAPPLNVCLQVNVGGEAPRAASRRPNCRSWRRLWPPYRACPPRVDVHSTRRRRSLPPAYVVCGHAPGTATSCMLPDALDTLSMGMSDDFEAAIREGATIVRVGTALFGERPRRQVQIRRRRSKPRG